MHLEPSYLSLRYVAGACVFAAALWPLARTALRRGFVSGTRRR